MNELSTADDARLDAAAMTDRELAEATFIIMRRLEPILEMFENPPPFMRAMMPNGEGPS